MTGIQLCILTAVYSPKRANFISIQNSSGIAAEGYETMPVATGMESVISHRASSTFATTSQGAGRVVEINAKAVVVEYDDPTLGREYAPLGLRHGTVAGLTVPHTLVTNLKVGDTVQPGQNLSFNQAFFKPDPLVPGQVVYKPAMLVRTALIDGTDTLEDSSAISAEVSDRLSTKVTYPRCLVIKSDEVVHNLVEMGTHVDTETILCNIEQGLTANAGLFDEDSYAALSVLAANSPKAEHAGDVDNIVVYYNGDPDQFGPSQAALIRESDKRLARESKLLGKSTRITGRVDERVSIRGNRLAAGELAIVVYITTRYGAGVGDKGVFAHQLKTTFGRVLTGVNETYDGKPIQAIFGYQSVSDRIVNSPEAMGTTITLSLKVRDLTVAAYRS